MPKPSDGSRPAALVLAPEPPYPMVGGGALRTASVLEYLAGRYDVDLITFQQPGAPDPAASIPPGRIRRICTIPLPFHSKSPAATVVRNVRRWLSGAPPLMDRFAGFERAVAGAIPHESYDIALIEHFWCAPYVDILAPGARRIVLNLHNIESVWLDSAAAVERVPVRAALRRWADRCRTLERALLPRFSTVLVTSDSDARIVSQLAPTATTVVYPNAIPSVPVPQVERTHSVVFAGNLEYRPNITAIRFFHRDIWPNLRRRWPALEWRIVGVNHGRIAAQFASDPHIRVIGPVSDAIQTIAESQVALVPLLSGSGTRLKIIEAWAAGTPVVSTSMGAEGLPARSGEHLLIADTPEEFAAAVTKILESQEDPAGIGEDLVSRARALYEHQFSWDVAWKTLSQHEF